MKRKSSKERTSKSASKRKRELKDKVEMNDPNFVKRETRKTNKNDDEVNYHVNQLTLKHTSNAKSPTRKTVSIPKTPRNNITKSKTKGTARMKLAPKHAGKDVLKNLSEVKETELCKAKIDEDHCNVRRHDTNKTTVRPKLKTMKLTEPISTISEVDADDCSDSEEDEEEDEEDGDDDEDVDDDDEYSEDDEDSDSSCDCDDCRREAGKKPIAQLCNCPLCRPQPIRSVRRKQLKSLLKIPQCNESDSEYGNEDNDSESEDENSKFVESRKKRDDNQNENSNTKEGNETDADESSDGEESSDQETNDSQHEQVSAAASTTVVTSVSHVTGASGVTSASTHVSSDIQHSHCEVPNCRGKVFSACPKCEILVCYKHLNEDIACCKDHGKDLKNKSWWHSLW